METCYRCGRRADYICPKCGSKICKDHMELRYAGPDRGFRSRYMCPVCWKVKHRVLNEQMLRADQYKRRIYIVGSGK